MSIRAANENSFVKALDAAVFNSFIQTVNATFVFAQRSTYCTTIFESK